MTSARRLLIDSQKIIYGQLSGFHRSLARGQGYDFVELRRYEQGDDVRTIDWKSSSKMDDLLVKIYHEERQLQVVVVMLPSASMGFGSRGWKYETATHVAMSVGRSVVSMADTLGVLVVNDREKGYIPPSRHPTVLYRMAQMIEGEHFYGQTVDYSYVCQTIMRRLKKRSLVVVVGDFFPQGGVALDPTVWKGVATRHDVVMVAVRDHLEENPTYFGVDYFVDPSDNTGWEGSFDLASLQAYRTKLQQCDESFFSGLRHYRVRAGKVMTDEVVGRALGRIFGS